MKSEFLDLYTGVKETHYYDEQEDSLTFHRSQDAEPILEANKRSYNEFPHKTSRKFKGEMHRVASIPNVVVEQWMKEGINFLNPDEKDQKRIKEKLNDPANVFFRTMPGKI